MNMDMALRHTDGSCYATGYTYSSGWVSGGWDTSYSGGYEGYVVKFNIAEDMSGLPIWEERKLITDRISRWIAVGLLYN